MSTTTQDSGLPISAAAPFEKDQPLSKMYPLSLWPSKDEGRLIAVDRQAMPFYLST
jgi:hypothetical protein